ncbi:MAG: FG-GAP-like repeat-containing protein, partial [Rhodothermales bacterium]
MHRLLLAFVAPCGLWLVTSLAGCSVTGPSLDDGGERMVAAIPSLRVVAPFEVIKPDGTPYDLPFLGGMNVPRPQLVDIDGDGDLDLFVQEYTGAVMFFENTGSANAAEYTWRSDRYEGLDVGEWYRFADLGGDGRIDLLAEQPFSYIRYYRNVGTPTEPAFEPAADTLRDVDGDPVFSDRQNIPNVTDIDCDRLADLFIGRLDGTVTRYEAVDSTAVPVFRLVTERFEDIEIVAQFGQPGDANPAPMPNIPGDDPAYRGPDLGPDRRTATNTTAPSRSTSSGGRHAVALHADPLHGANTMTFGDIDGDGDMDLFWGDFFEPSLLRIENRGSCRNPDLSGEPMPFPPPEPIQSSGYNAPTFGDLDGDDDMDLLVGVLGGAFNPNRTAANNLYFYEQIGDGQFELRTRRFLDQIDVGSESYPVLVDLDGDGDDDLLVANKISSQDSRTSVL